MRFTTRKLYKSRTMKITAPKGTKYVKYKRTKTGLTLKFCKHKGRK